MKNELLLKASRLVSKANFQLKKHSPEILLTAGLVGTVVGTVLACKATTKVSKIIDEKNDTVKKINDVLNDENIDYNEEDYKKDLTIVYTQTGLKLIKLYAPAVSITVLSFASIIAGHKILKKRNIAIAAAYAIVDKSFKKYRNNVIEKFGESVDKELRYGIVTKEKKTKDKDGNTIKEKIEYLGSEDNPVQEYSDYSKFFDASSSNFEKDPEYNLMFLRRQQDYANELLKSRGYVFLNEVYDLLGIQRTKAGQIVGWIYDEKNPKGDNYIDFGIYKNNEAHRRFVNGYEYNVLLDFNVDGIIYDNAIFARV